MRTHSEVSAARAARAAALAAIGIDASEPFHYGRASSKVKPIGRPASKASRTVKVSDYATYGEATAIRRIGDRYRPIDPIAPRYSATVDRLPPHRDDTDPRAMRRAARGWRRSTFTDRTGAARSCNAQPTADELKAMPAELYAALWCTCYNAALRVVRGSMMGDRAPLADDAPFERERASSTMHDAPDARATDIATDAVGELWGRVASGRKAPERAFGYARRVARNLAVSLYGRTRIHGGLEADAVTDTGTPLDAVTLAALALPRGAAAVAAARVYLGGATCRHLTAEGIRVARHRARARLADALLRAGIVTGDDVPDDAAAPSLAGFWCIDSSGAPTFASYGGDDDVTADPASRVACVLAVMPVG